VRFAESKGGGDGGVGFCLGGFNAGPCVVAGLDVVRVHGDGLIVDRGEHGAGVLPLVGVELAERGRLGGCGVHFERGKKAQGHQCQA